MNRIYSIKRRLRTLINICLLSFVVAACSDFTENDLTNKEVVLKAPGDSFKTTVSTVTFWWEYVSDATLYELQIVSPSFQNARQLILDTFLTKNTYTYALLPGDYEWGVIASNNSSSTDLWYRSLTIDTSDMLSGVKILLVYPNNNFYTSKQKIRFKWQSVEKATKYIFEVRKNNENGELVSTQTVFADTLSAIFPQGIYCWSLQALNLISASQISSRIFTVDTVAPGNPTLVSPDDKDTIWNKDVVLIWRRPSSSLSPISDSVLISTDSTFRKVDEAVFVDSTTYTMATNDPGMYFWKVRSLDAAGNISPHYSNTRKFWLMKTKK
jgi:hypothetical protein